MSKRFSASGVRGGDSPSQTIVQDNVTFREDSPRPPVPGSEDLQTSIEKQPGRAAFDVLDSSKHDKNLKSAFRSVPSKSSSVNKPAKLRVGVSSNSEAYSAISGRNEKCNIDSESLTKREDRGDGDCMWVKKVYDEVNGNNVWLSRSDKTAANRDYGITAACQNCCSCSVGETCDSFISDGTGTDGRSYPAFTEDSTTSWSSKYGEPEDLDELLAPRGFEPEGSACRSPEDFQQDVMDSYQVRWSEDLKQLMEDGEGLTVFRTYVKEVLGSIVMDFWLAATGFKKMAADVIGKDPIPADEEMRIKRTGKAIGRTYVKHKQLSFSPEIKQDVLDRLKLDLLDVTIFDTLLVEVERLISVELYPKFLSSDAYSNYIIHRRSTSSTSPLSAISISPRIDGPANLNNQRLTENLDASKVVNQCLSARGDDSVGSVVTSGRCAVSATPTLGLGGGMGGGMLATVLEDVELSSSEQGSRPHDLCINRCVSPCSSSYLPVSAQDSDMQSLSSDLTDDTMSLTDSSIDGRQGDYGSGMGYGGLRYSYKKQQLQMRRNADTNRCTDLFNSVIPPRTTMPKERYLAEKDPGKFAEILTDKLRVVDNNEIPEKYERLHEAMKGYEKAAAAGDMTGRAAVLSSDQKVRNVTSMPLPFKSRLLEMARQDHDDMNADSILERHCKRVFDGSSGQSPTSGRHSPELNKTKLDPRSLAQVNNQSGVSRNRKEISGQQYHRQGGNAVKSRTSEQQMKMMVKSCGVFSHEELLQMNAGKSAALTGVIDGKNAKISADKTTVPYTTDLTQPLVNSATNRKVMQWMTVNENQVSELCEGLSRTFSESKQSAEKSHSKKSKSIHAGDLSLSHRSTVKPHQPFVQDPSMPLMSLPDTCTQLEEAKRRLEEGSKAKSSKIRYPQKVSGSIVGAAHKQAARPSSVQPISAESYRASADEIVPQKTDIRLKKKSSTADQSNTSQSQSGAEFISIIYFFCDEKIPYSTKIYGNPSTSINLLNFKQAVAKKGQYKYFFKRACDEFDSGFVYEEIDDDNAILPINDGKISAKIARYM